MNNFSILVNTCDKFEDCWNPFFKLFSIYWPQYKGKIYLNTEYKNFFYEKLTIIPVKGCEFKKDANIITWSECLKRALERIDEDLILYVQEDYFFKNNVKNDIVNKYVGLMNDNKDIHCIHLTDQAVKGFEASKEHKGLNIVDLNQRYRVSCQAALWRKDVLMEHIRTYENAWQFEEFASKRSAILKHNFYVVDDTKVVLNKYEIIPYIFTGIVRGQWLEEVVQLFKTHNIKVDYTIRGFLSEAPKRTLKNKIIDKCKRLPILMKNYLDLRALKKNS